MPSSSTMKPLMFLIGLFVFLSTTTTSAHGSSNSIGSSLAGSKLGDQKVGLSSVKSYLEQFGYLSPSNTKTFDDFFDDNLESGIIAYQKFFHLKPTGTLDQSTLASMRKPRCGMADIHHNNTTGVHGRNLYSYFPGTPTWPANRRSLRYIFYSSGTAIAPSVLRAVYARAFSRWQRVTLLTFTEVTSVALADILIQFYVGNHGDGYPFDGRLGVLAHAFAPTNGRLHFDGSEVWTAALPDAASPDLYRLQYAVDLESVAVHEIGHILGLGHSTVTNAIMFPSITLNTRKVTLASDDIQGIRSLYGTRL